MDLIELITKNLSSSINKYQNASIAVPGGTSPIKIFNEGNLSRDFTYIDDIVDGVSKILLNNSKKDLYKIYNIGNNNPVNLLDFINEIENQLNIKSKRCYLPMQAGDVVSTEADTTLLENWINFKPSTSINTGIDRFIKWYLDFYKIKL